MTSMSAPTITHPTWCDPESCDDTDAASTPSGSVLHWSQTAVHEFEGTGGTFLADVALARVDDVPSGPQRASAPTLRMSGEGDVTLDQLDDLARWLTARVAEYRHAIATEDGGTPADETTVLDEDLDLSVRTENDLVVMTGYSGDDGTWNFTADEARDLALALLDHAARLA